MEADMERATIDSSNAAPPATPHPFCAALPRPVRHADWVAELTDFSRRNVGRLTTIDLDDPALDPQVLIANSPLLGTMYDAGDEAVEVILGDERPDGRHFTHPIWGVTSISVIRGGDGRDAGLRVAHGAGLTRLSFTS
jgi:hypothetical protein